MGFLARRKKPTNTLEVPDGVEYPVIMDFDPAYFSSVGLLRFVGEDEDLVQVAFDMEQTGLRRPSVLKTLANRGAVDWQSEFMDWEDKVDAEA